MLRRSLRWGTLNSSSLFLYFSRACCFSVGCFVTFFLLDLEAAWVGCAIREGKISLARDRQKNDGGMKLIQSSPQIPYLLLIPFSLVPA